jgi:glutathione S-transferase
MAKLLHFPVDPFCRRIRVALGEYDCGVEVIEERPWENRASFVALSPAGILPVFIDDDGFAAIGIEAVSEYLDETRGSEATTLVGVTAAERAETRRLVAWFDGKFHAEVSGPVLTEKVIRRFVPREVGGGAPDMARVRRGLAMVREHLDFIGDLAEQRNWLAGERLSAADLAAAAHLSALDYLGDVPWQENASAKAWYQRIKCRPSFRPLLADHIRGMPPPRLYADLDF